MVYQLKLEARRAIFAHTSTRSNQNAMAAIFVFLSHTKTIYLMEDVDWVLAFFKFVHILLSSCKCLSLLKEKDIANFVFQLGGDTYSNWPS